MKELFQANHLGPCGSDAVTFDERSRNAKATVILLHGLTGTPAEMEGLANYLHDKGFMTFVPCLSGHGVVVEELRRTTIRQWLDDIDDAFRKAQAMGNSKIFVVGLSFGGLLALNMALRNVQIAGVVALSAPFRAQAYLTELILSALSYCPDMLLNYLGTYAKKERVPGGFAFERRAYPRHSYGALARLLAMRRRVSRRLHHVRCPVLVMQDPFDHHLAASAALVLQNKLTGADSYIHYIPRGEHELTLGHSHALVYKIIEEFVMDLAIDQPYRRMPISG